MNDDNVNVRVPAQWIGRTWRPAVICFVIAEGIMSNRRPVWVSLICFVLCPLSGWPVTAVSQGGLLDLETVMLWFSPAPSAVMGADQKFPCAVRVTAPSSLMAAEAAKLSSEYWLLLVIYVCCAGETKKSFITLHLNQDKFNLSKIWRNFFSHKRKTPAAATVKCYLLTSLMLVIGW